MILFFSSLEEMYDVMKFYIYTTFSKERGADFVENGEKNRTLGIEKIQLEFLKYMNMNLF